jgi:hypothetical protein
MHPPCIYSIRQPQSWLLFKHASFDPEYHRARDWIRHHPVGPAVLSPVLIIGLVGALVEASVPQSITVSSSVQQIWPLIVGASVCVRARALYRFRNSRAPFNDVC